MSWEASLTAAINRIGVARDSHQLVKIFTHIDADGLAAGALLAKTFIRAQIPFQVRVLRQLEPTYISQIAHEHNQSPFLGVFADFGSGQVELLARSLPSEDVIIFDHHQIPPDVTEELPYHCNPELAGIDGGREVSGAGVCYCFAKTLNPENADLSQLAVVGATGDRQDNPQGHAFVGLNEIIARDGVEAGTVAIMQGIRFFGRETRPIANALALSTEPYIKGLTGNQSACEHLLHSAGIDFIDPKSGKTRTLADLSTEETQVLLSSLVSFCVVNLNLDPDLVTNLIGTIFVFPRESPGKPLRDAQEFASHLNSCGRTGHPDIAIGIGLGDRTTMLAEAEAILVQYRHQLGDILDRIEHDQAIEEMENIYVLDGEGKIDEKVIGTICSIALGSFLRESVKPLIGVASSDEGMLKVSGRASIEILAAGLNLAQVMRETAEELQVDSPGGGHAAAAGARIPESLKQRFFDVINRKIGEHLHC